MSNIFTQLKDFVEKPNRNTFDLSYQNNLTMEFGKLYPVFCKEVVPGDSMRIKPTFGLRFMPLVFPVQTRMQANLHFFYVRNRNLWKDWPDFIGRTKKNLVLPFLSPSVAKKVCKTRGLGDYFGIPTTLAGEFGANEVIRTQNLYQHITDWEWFRVYHNYNDFSNARDFFDMTFNQIVDATDASTGYEPQGGISQSCAAITKPLRGRIGTTFALTYRKSDVPRSIGDVDPISLTADAIMMNDAEMHDTFGDAGYYQFREWNKLDVCFMIEDDGDYKNVIRFSYMCPFAGQEDQDAVHSLDMTKTSQIYWSEFGTLIIPNDERSEIEKEGFSAFIDWLTENGYQYRIMFKQYAPEYMTFDGVNYNTTMFTRTAAFPAANPDGSVSDLNEAFGILQAVIPLENSGTRDLSELDDLFNPYANGDIKVSALPFRAYESIYNAFYRNQFNDPFVLNGQKEFNKFITTDEGGEDSTDYDLMFRNYEQDFLTSAKQSPVDGDITPLVGVSGTGTFTFQNADGSQVNITPKFAEDGTTIIGLETVEGTPENTSSIRRLMDMASVGISINDFRNVNALQRWLETNLRRGYRYKDQLLSHFGVEAKFDVLDMPEFIGGMSEPVMVNQINQSVDQTGTADGLGDFSKVLGSFAGQASVLAQSKHDVEKYCDEHGFIIGILSISPVPNYSQLLPKFFLKNNVLDYYFPEFGHIGNQPIPYSEVCPLQSYAAEVAGGDEKLTDVFGYQRAWYDYLASVDEVHGDFRTSLEGFLINRVFDVRPELGKDFLEVDPDNMSNPFSVTDKTDKILGQVYFDVTAQRPIPKFGIPRLE